MSETYLWLLSFTICVFAMWRKSPSAMWFGFLIFSHGYLFGDLAASELNSEMLGYMKTSGVFSVFSMIGCYALRKGVNDSIALWLTGISALCLSVNIVCLFAWSFRYPMEGFNYVFAGILFASVAVILKGDVGGLGKSGSSHVGVHVYGLSNKIYRRLVGMENRERIE